jgi:phosphatidylglycerophosphate synthase
MSQNRSKSKLASGNNDVIDKMLYPFIFQIAKYLPKSITPNQLTIMGSFFGLIAIFFMFFITNKIVLLLCSFFIFIWWLFDALDGIHARNTEQSSSFGGFLDHFFDTLIGAGFMFSYLVYFKIFTPLFVFIMLYRLAAQAIFFLTFAHTQSFDIPMLGSTVEVFLFITVLISYFFYDGSISIFGFFQFTIPQLCLLGYLIAIPIGIWNLFYKVKRKA